MSQLLKTLSKNTTTSAIPVCSTPLRNAGKDISQDVREAIETLERWEAMRAEDMPIPTSCNGVLDPRAK
jgi:hypothetical protein